MGDGEREGTVYIKECVCKEGLIYFFQVLVRYQRLAERVSCFCICNFSEPRHYSVLGILHMHHCKS